VVPPIFQCKISILSIVTNVVKALSNLPRGAHRWEKPEVRKIKVNVDASFHGDVRAGTTSAVIRDGQGKFLVASSTYFPNISSAATAEALAMMEGLALANHYGGTNVIMESDSLETINACNGDEVWWGEESAIFADYIDLASHIDGVEYRHCYREANEVAHELARNCFTDRNSCNLLIEPPSFILPMLINDVTII
jgi:ribonuclease HI